MPAFACDLPSMGFATVHASSLERMMEELCRLRVNPLQSAIKDRPNGFAIDGKSKFPPDKGGVYVYWWVGPAGKLAKAERTMVLHGPGGSGVKIRFDSEWMGLDANLPVPLYVGKTAKNIRNRMGRHLMLSTTKKIIKPGLKKTKAPTTTCQVRAGIERLFPKDTDPLKLIRKHLALSYVQLDGDKHAVNRFYLEDLAIGRMRPILNVDIER